MIRLSVKQSLWSTALRLSICATASVKHKSINSAAIAQWIHLHLPSCRPRFESHAHHLCLYHYSQFVLYFHVKRTEISKKRPYLTHFNSAASGRLFQTANISIPMGWVISNIYPEKNIVFKEIKSLKMIKFTWRRTFIYLLMVKCPWKKNQTKYPS